MPFRARLIVFGYPALEIVTLWWLSTLIGWLDVVGVLVVSALVGGLIMRTAGRSAFATMRQAGLDGRVPTGAAGRHAMQFLAGLLIAIPGVWTDLVGLLLLLPPVRALLLPRFLPRIPFPQAEFGSPDTIQGTVVDSTVVDSTVVDRRDRAAQPGEASRDIVAEDPDDDGPGCAGAIGSR